MIIPVLWGRNRLSGGGLSLAIWSCFLSTWTGLTRYPGPCPRSFHGPYPLASRKKVTMAIKPQGDGQALTATSDPHLFSSHPAGNVCGP